MGYACGFSTEQFWRATPRDLYYAVSGMALNLERSHWLAAWHLSGVVNLVSKRPVTPAKLLGKEGGLLQEVDGKTRHRDARAAMAELTRSFLASETD